MSQTPKTLKSGLLVVALLVAACGGGANEGGGASLAGTYNCGPEGEAPQDVLEVREDGTLTFTPGALPGADPGAPAPEEGTWSVDGDSGAFQFPDFEDRFTVTEDGLEFAHAGAPENEKLVCTRAS